MPESNLMGMLMQSMAALAAVLAIFAGLVWALRKLQHGSLANKKGSLQIVQRIAIDARNSIVEIQYHGQHHLLSVGQSGIQRIHLAPPNAHTETQPDNNGQAFSKSNVSPHNINTDDSDT